MYFEKPKLGITFYFEHHLICDIFKTNHAKGLRRIKKINEISKLELEKNISAAH